LAFGFVAVGLMSGASGHLGIEIDREVIQSSLGGRVTNDRIEIFYDRGKIKPEEAQRILEDHTFRLHQLEALFGDRYPHKISSYVYGSRSQKRRLMGAQRTFIAKPWLSEIHVHKTPYGAGVIHHELAHVYLSQYTDSWLGVPTRAGILPKMMLIEGAAMAVEFYGGSLTQHEWSAAMERTGLAPDLEALMNPTSFWGVNPGRGYVPAGSFIRWLIDTHGVDRFKALYNEGDFAGSYGMGLSYLLSEWKAFLKEIKLPSDAEDRARTRFGRAGMLARVCPLVMPRLEAEIAKLRKEKRFREALENQEDVVGFVPENPRKRIPLIDLHTRLKQIDEARKAREELARLDKTTGVMLSVADEILADGLWRVGKVNEAGKAYGALLEGDLSEGRRRTVWAKILIGIDQDLEPIFGPYLLSSGEDDDLRYLLDAVLDVPDHRLSLYLAGRRYALENHFEAGVSLLERALEAPPLSSEEANVLFEREIWRLLGRSYGQVGAYEDAKRAFQEVLKVSTNQATLATSQDWLERIEWLMGGRRKAKK
jgi:tetratricopeptide (TPR) repeat protein